MEWLIFDGIASDHFTLGLSGPELLLHYPLETQEKLEGRSHVGSAEGCEVTGHGNWEMGAE